MMRKLIAALVAGTLIMLWQTASHTFLQLHASQEMYTPAQDTILQVLSTHLKTDGQYFIPGVPPGTSMEEMEKVMASSMGKPYASILYHPVQDMDMTMNMLRGFGTYIILAFVLVWLIGQFKQLRFSNVLLASLAVGFISFSFHPYAGYIWYKIPGVNIELLDSLLAFGLAGLWLGWYLPKEKTA